MEQQSKYDLHKEKIIELCNKKKLPHEVAAELGLKESTLKKKLTDWRKNTFIGGRNHNREGDEKINKYNNAHTLCVYDGKRFIPKQHYVWIKANGEIPKNYIIIFKDGDKSNYDLSNLDMVSLSSYQTKRYEAEREVKKGAKTANRDKPGCNRNWVYGWMAEEKKIKIPVPPKTEGIRLDSRTIIYPKNLKTTVNDLQQKYGNRLSRIKSSCKQDPLNQ